MAVNESRRFNQAFMWVQVRSGDRDGWTLGVIDVHKVSAILPTVDPADPDSPIKVLMDGEWVPVFDQSSVVGLLYNMLDATAVDCRNLGDIYHEIVKDKARPGIVYRRASESPAGDADGNA